MTEQRVYFEPADRPPPAYFQRKLAAGDTDDGKPLKIVPFATPDPEKWLKAPEFVPRSKRLARAFDLPSALDDVHPSPPPRPLPPPAALPFQYPPPMQQPFVTRLQMQMQMPLQPPTSIFPFAQTTSGAVAGRGMVPELNGIPAGYSANITRINAGVGPPIPAIVLRKKRRRRNKHHTNSMTHTHSNSPCSSHPSDPNAFNSDGDDELNERNNSLLNDEAQIEEGLSGSCPDLSEERLQKWDDYLYEAAQAQESNRDAANEDDRMKSSVYEIVPRCLLDIAEQHVEGITSEEIRRIDREMNGNKMTTSMVIERLANYQLGSDDARTEKTLAEELGQLSFRPEISKYGYPQIDASRLQMVSIDGKDSKRAKNSIIDREALHAYLDQEDEDFEEDFLEGINITVNKFDACDDLTLSDVESPSRFEQIHRAIKKNADLRAPDRVCCTIS